MHQIAATLLLAAHVVPDPLMCLSSWGQTAALHTCIEPVHLSLQFAGGVLTARTWGLLWGQQPASFHLSLPATAIDEARMLMTRDEELNLTMPVRMGQAIDVVAQTSSSACQPKPCIGHAAMDSPRHHELWLLEQAVNKVAPMGRWDRPAACRGEQGHA